MKHLLILFLLFTACGKSTTTPEPPNFDFSGTWDGELLGGVNDITFTTTVIQSGNNISGTLLNNSGLLFDVIGIAWGDNVSITCEDVNSPAYYVVCDGTCNGFYASGSWYDSIGQSGFWEGWKR